MVLPYVTSLSDLAFKAKTNEYYQQLVVALQRQQNPYTLRPKYFVPSTSQFEEAMNFFEKVVTGERLASCVRICIFINESQVYVREKPTEIKPSKCNKWNDVWSKSSFNDDLWDDDKNYQYHSS